MRFRVLAILLTVFGVSVARQACGVERWPVKVGTDKDVQRVKGTAILATIAKPSAAGAPGGPAPQKDGRALPPRSPDDLLHQVVPGDTLIGLAATFLEPGTDWRRLQRANHVADPRRLQPGSTLRLPAAWLRQQPTVAEVIHVVGSVSVQRVGGQAEPVAVGALLRAGDVLRAQPESSLSLKFADGSRLLLRPDSELRISRLLQYGRGAAHQLRLQLRRGNADSSVPPPAAGGWRRYEIDTPSVNLGVRGTEFRTHVEPETQQSRLEVLEGSVAVTSARAPAKRQQHVDAGQGAVFDAGQPVAARERLPEAPDLSGVAPRLERVPLRLAWADQPGASVWRAQVFELGADPALLLDGSFDMPRARWADLPDGRYELRVRAIDGRGLEGVDARRPFVLKARPVPPFTIEPHAGAKVYGDSVQFAWTRPEGASTYQLQLSDSDDFDTPRADLTGLAEPEHRLALPPGSYHWRLASVRADGDQGPFGDAQSFTLKPIPQAPRLESPQLRDDALVLRWAAGPPGETYELQLARDREFSDIVQSQRSELPEVALARPGAGRYFVRVRAVDPDGYVGPYGDTQQFEIPVSRWWLLVPLGLLWLLAL